MSPPAKTKRGSTTKGLKASTGRSTQQSTLEGRVTRSRPQAGEGEPRSVQRQPDIQMEPEPQRRSSEQQQYLSDEESSRAEPTMYSPTEEG